MRGLARAYDLVFIALGLISALLIGAVALGLSTDVVLRNLDRIPFAWLKAVQRDLGLRTIPWMLEACEYAIFVSTFLGAPWVLRLGAHVRVDVFVQNLPKRVTFALELFADLVGMATSGVILYYAIVVARGSIHDNARIIKMFIIPEWWVFAVVAFSALLLIVEFVRRFVAAAISAEALSSAPTSL